jgi:hypothetical protein
MTPDILSRALTAIERAELPLLSWGVVNGALTEDEAIRLLGDELVDEDPDELLDALESARLIRFLDHGRLRSRSAETVRLAALLRQWFHKRPWESAPNLVSDYRFLSNPRGVPDRTAVSVDELIDQLSSLDSFLPAHERSVRALLAGRSVSEFQARSTARLFNTTSSPRSTGTVVAAGTGAGKTLAFYLPALSYVMAAPVRGRHPQIVAIYPRKELLRDQLGSLMDTLAGLRRSGIETPSVGALYSATPSSREHAMKFGGWRKSGESLVSPVLACPECGGDLNWPASADSLVCASCEHRLDSELFRITRRQIQQRPPDILFTTTEMVNRNLGNSSMRRLFVGDQSSGPKFVLFDEIHTYSGIHGAQVANLLRRWKAENQHSTSYVGLSATLADPVGFFADLTGLSSSDVQVVTPRPNEIQEASREYLLVLRGDPVSQTSLLSTTIQTTMLLRRMLDRAPDDPSRGLFGSKVFAFTDDLDVVNRLHHQLQDAEGWKPDGVNQRPSGSLANLRNPAPDSRDREEAGQVWELARLIGTMQQPNRVARTTSQDSGVDVLADTVVATASLEVGFDDPDVGAVIQHKAPRDSAQFIQRRGRAGRNPIMRPWTAVILSDYGRDRLAFQGYESLASPVVLPARMPIHNRALLKIQGAWILLDLLQSECGSTSLSYVLSGKSEQNKNDARRLLRFVEGLMTPAGLERLVWLVRRKLSVTEDLARAVVWDPPRALATAVLPTLHRGLAVAAEGHDATSGRTVLWEFVPAALFSSLLTPEVLLRAAKQYAPEEDDEFLEPISRALRMFAPGRVSYRYALRGRGQRMWLAPPPSDAESFDLGAALEQCGELPVPADAGVSRLLNPAAIRLTTPPVEIPDMAYGSLDWRIDIETTGTPIELDIPARSPWAATIHSVEASAHRFGAPLQITRYATELNVDRRTTADPYPTTHSMSYEGDHVGLGFMLDVDGLRVDVRVPDIDLASHSDGALMRALRPAWFEHCARNSVELTGLMPSTFHREWLAQLLVSALTAAAILDGRSLDDTLHDWSAVELRTRLHATAEEIFGTLPIGDDAAHQQSDGLLGDIDAYLGNPEVLTWLQVNADALWTEGHSPDFADWVAGRFLTTIGAGLIQAAQTTCPEHDASDLRIETSAGPAGSGRGVIHIVEDEPGGSGLIETLIERYIDDPRAFWALVSAALSDGPGERTDATLRSMLLLLAEPAIRSAADEIRSAGNLQELTGAWADLRREMYARGIATDPTVISALATRVFKSGSSVASEELLAKLIDRWDEVESVLGIELELRIFAFAASRDPDVVEALETIVGQGARDRDWALTQVVGLLWNRGARVRSASLQVYNPYTTLLPTERLLAQDVARRDPVAVDLANDGWRSQVDQQLVDVGAVAIVSDDVGAMSAALAQLLVQPTYLGSLETFPRVVAVRRTHLRTEVIVELRELVQ